MPRYRVTQGVVHLGEQTAEVGDEVVVPDAVAQSFSDRLEPAAESESEAGTGTTSDDGVNRESDRATTEYEPDDGDEPEPTEPTPEGDPAAVADEELPPEDEVASSEAESESNEAEIDYSDLTISELESALDEHEPDEDVLQQMLEHERSHKDRSGAKAALRSRLGEDSEDRE